MRVYGLSMSIETNTLYGKVAERESTLGEVFSLTSFFILSRPNEVLLHSVTLKDDYVKHALRAQVYNYCHLSYVDGC